MSASGLRKLLPVFAFLFFATITLALWQQQLHYERELILRHTETSVEQAQIRIEGLMRARMAALELLADRWGERRPPDFSRKRFLAFAKSIFENYPGFTGINWIDPDGVIQWVFPEEWNAKAKGRSVYDHPDPLYGAALKDAWQSMSAAITPYIELYQGGKGFSVFLPLLYDSEIQGYLNGVFQIERIVELSLPKSILDDYEVTIYEHGQPVFHSGRPGNVSPENDSVHVARDIEVGAGIWRIAMQPDSAINSSEYLRSLPFLGFGLMLSAALSLLLHFLLRRMEMYRESRNLALSEVNERKRAEDALRENEKKLETLLSELSAKNEELESFIYTISHDLKTPIVTIDGFIGALREDFGNALSGDAEVYLKYMSDAARKMEALINDLLDLSRIGRLVGKKAIFPFGDLVKNALEILQPQIEARGISVHVQEDLPGVYGEEKRLNQVVFNLLANAVKYMEEDNPVPRINVGINDQESRKVFFVSDNGIGIDEKYFGHGSKLQEAG